MNPLQWVSQDRRKLRQRLIMAELIARPGCGPLSRLRPKRGRGPQAGAGPQAGRPGTSRQLEGGPGGGSEEAQGG